MSVASDVQAYLGMVGLVDGSTDWPSVLRNEYDTPDGRLVVLTEDGGPGLPLYAAEGMGDVASGVLGVQVRVRGPVEDGNASAAKAHEIVTALHAKAGVQMGSHTYELVTALSAPIALPFDGKRRPNHTVSFRLRLPMHALVGSN